MPAWLVVTSKASLALALVSTIIVVVDLLRGNRQHMWIMNVVWPLTAAWAGPLGAWGYFRYGRASSHRLVMEAERKNEPPPAKRQPFAIHVAKGTTHCGSGCTLGDMIAELVFAAFPLAVLGHRIFGAWIYDFVLALLIGIAFQYFTIKPMHGGSNGGALRAALKADTLSLAAWQLGMYGWMAIATFGIFHRELHPTTAVFWFMMQLAMFLGFATAYPVNWWLLRTGVKEAM